MFTLYIQHELICKLTNGKFQNPCNGFASVIQIDPQNLTFFISLTSNQKSQTMLPTMALFFMHPQAP
jgi:hypothetical protein